MTAFAACLFVLAAFASLCSIAAGWARLGGAARELRAQLAACPETTAISWNAIERRPLFTPMPLGGRRAVRQALVIQGGISQSVRGSGLAWPAPAIAA